MSSKRARASRTDPVPARDVLPLSARIAWSYLASLGAVVIAAGVVVLGNVSVGTVACRAAGEDTGADCRLGWAVVSGLAGLALGWVILALLLHLGWRYAVAATGWAAMLVAVDRLEEWWWWGLALLVPLAAALVSHEWAPSRRFRLWANWGLALLVAIAIGAISWWLVA